MLAPYGLCLARPYGLCLAKTLSPKVAPYVSPGYDDSKMRGLERSVIDRHNGVSYLKSWYFASSVARYTAPMHKIRLSAWVMCFVLGQT